MITNRKELKEYLQADLSRYKGNPSFIRSIICGYESYGTKCLIKRWRKTEYYYNTLNKKNPLSLLRFGISFFLFRRMSLYYKIILPINVVGPGLYIPHRVGGVIINALRVGRNFTISSGCIIGKKGIDENRPIIGDNVECCIGAKVIGKVHVGDNVIIAPNSVVVKNVMKGDVVSGVPAYSIKIKNNNGKNLV